MEVSRNSIIIRNVDLNSQEFKSAQYKYSLYDPVYHKYTFSAFSIVDKDLFFPASITAEVLIKIFPRETIEKNYKNSPTAEKISYNMKHQPRDELQQEALRFLIKMKSDPDNHQRFLSLETGSGKTYVTINAISKFGARPIIIVDTLDLASQWKREFLSHTDLLETDIIILSGQEIVEKEMANPSAKVYIAIHRTLGNLMAEDSNNINKLMKKLKIGFRVFDESHVEFANICRINSFSNVNYTLYLTATPSRSNFNEDSLYGKVFRNIPYFNGKAISGEKYHTVILAKINSHPSFEVKVGVKTKYGFSQARWAKYILEEAYQTLLEAVVGYIDKFKLLERKKKTAIMLPTIELINKLKGDLTIQYPTIEIGTFIGDIPKDKREAELGKLIFITNDKIFDKAIDVKDLEVLINFVPLGSLVKTEQILGRLRNRENYSSILVDVTDEGFEECVKQSKIRKRFYKKKAKKIIELTQEN